MQENSKTIAMAALVQAANQVQSIARNDNCDSASLRCNIESLFRFQVDSTRAIYEDENDSLIGLEKGLRQLSMLGKSEQFSNQEREVWRYVWLILQLSSKLRKDSGRVRRLGQLLHGFGSQHLVYDASYEYFSDLAVIYQQILSSLSPKIMVAGENGYLQKEGNAEKVRSLLLSGVRAGYLWWQLGGQRWRFALPNERKKYIEQSKQLLSYL